MNNLQFDILMQCPCSGGSGANPLLLLAVFVGIWLLFSWIRMLIKSEGVSFMSKTLKIVIVVALIAAVGIVIAVKQNGTENSSEAGQSSRPDENTSTSIPEEPAITGANSTTDSQQETSLPVLLDLGSKQCVPCKMMEPILEEFKSDYSDEFKTRFIDVREDRAAAQRFNIRVIPTQIFFDAEGNELFRHEGFYSKEDMLSKWEELGVKIEEKK